MLKRTAKQHALDLMVREIESSVCLVVFSSCETFVRPLPSYEGEAEEVVSHPSPPVTTLALAALTHFHYWWRGVSPPYWVFL